MRPGLSRMLTAALVVTAALAGTASVRAAESHGETDIFLTGATIHPVSGEAIPRGTLHLSGASIAAVGSGLDIPAGARRIDVTGKHIYPVFIHAGSALGLTEVSAVASTVDAAENGDLNPELRVEVAFHGDSRLLPVARAGGVLYAHVAPRGGLLSGTSAVFRLEGWNWQDMVVRAPVGLHLRYPRVLAPTRSFGRRPPKTQSEVDEERKIQEEILEKLFEDARAYLRARDSGTSPEPPRDQKLEALLPVLTGELPLFVHAEERKQIAAALEFVEKSEIPRTVLVSGADAAEFAGRLARDGVPVVLTGVLALPRRSWQAYDTAFTAAARLREAGVKIAIADGGSTFEAAHSRNLPFQAAMAVAHGLPHRQALAAITLDAAEILGVADRLGSIEAGKEASFLITDGDALEITTKIEAVWHAGAEVDRSSDRQWLLYQRYRHRPRASPAGASP